MSDRLSSALKELITLFTAKVDYLALYPSEVFSQDSDGSLQVFPDNQSIAKQAGVKLHSPFPHCKVTVTKGARVLLGFEEGDPSKPYCLPSWSSPDGTLTLIDIGSGSQFVALSNKVDQAFADLKTYIDAHTHPTGVGPSGPPASPYLQPATTACTMFKTQ
jgi:hypothetical protein